MNIYRFVCFCGKTPRGFCITATTLNPRAHTSESPRFGNRMALPRSQILRCPKNMTWEGWNISQEMSVSTHLVVAMCLLLIYCWLFIVDGCCCCSWSLDLKVKFWLLIVHCCWVLIVAVDADVAVGFWSVVDCWLLVVGWLVLISLLLENDVVMELSLLDVDW